MRLHEEKEDFKDLLRLTSDNYKISEVYVEKDYWVTYVLKNLYLSKYKENLVFKGGTSLSKAYKIIDRFSEDIDLQILDFNGGDSKKKTFIKNCEEELTRGLKVIDDDIRTRKHGNIRKTIYSYEKVSDKDDFFQASRELVLEINSLSTPEPFEKKEIRSLIADYLIDSNNEKYINEYGLESFKLSILDKRRTFVEKIFAVLDYSFNNDYIGDIAKNIRHLYDIYKLYLDESVKTFFNSDEFYKMANRVVVENDFYGRRKKTLYNESKFYNEDIFNKIKRTYIESFSAFLYDEVPDYIELSKRCMEVFYKIRIWENEYRIKAKVLNKKASDLVVIF